MSQPDEFDDFLDHQVREYGRQLHRSDSPRITEEDLLKRGFIHAGGTGTLLFRITARLRLNARPDLQGNYTRLELRWDEFSRAHFRFASLAEWDVWLLAFDRENPRH
jgi:hypothetical protein